jgi:uncharacterized protein YceH (UPF0502 family)
MSTETRAFTGPLALSSEEVRVLGCLLEKQRTTPDVYPLSLNALRLACNQSTNRDPVVDYQDDQIRESLHRLERRGLVRLASGRGSRAAKYRHLLAEALPLQAAEQAVLSVLMLRGPQTPGELKQRTERMHAFADLRGVHETLSLLIERGLAERLHRRPGQKEERYRQLLQEHDGEPAATAPPATGPQMAAQAGGEATAREDARHEPVAVPAPNGELEELRERVSRLERQVAALTGAHNGREAVGESSP